MSKDHSTSAAKGGTRGPVRTRRQRTLLRQRAELRPWSERSPAYLHSGRQPLTREEEAQLGQAVEQGEREAALAVVSSPAARAELRAIAKELRKGALHRRDLLRNAGEAGPSSSPELADELERIASPATALPKPQVAKSREERAEAIVRLRFERAVARRLEGAVRLAGEEAAVRALVRGCDASDQARKRLVERNLPLVFLIARRHLRTGRQLHDLVQEGTAGLIRAADKFDYRRGFRFATYAWWWIDQAIARGMAEDFMIRLPQHVIEKRTKLVRARRSLGRSPTVEQLAERSGLSAQAVRTLGELVAQPVSLDAPAGPEGEARVGDFVADRDAPPVDEAVAKGRLGTDLRALCAALTPRELRVLQMHYGLDGEKELTLEQIGAELSLSRERARQIEQSALDKLRSRAEEQQMRSYLE